MVTASYDLGQTVDTGTEPGVCVHSCYPLCTNPLATRSFTPAQVPLPTFFLFLFYPSLLFFLVLGFKPCASGMSLSQPGSSDCSLCRTLKSTIFHGSLSSSS